MARLFADASSEYLEIDSAVLTEQPVTFAAWFNVDDVATGRTLLWLGDKDAGDEYFAMFVDTGSNLVAATRSGTTRQASVGPVSFNTWQHACTVQASTTSRIAYLGTTKSGESTATSSPSGVDRTSIGRHGDSSPAGYMSGRIAEAAIWNVALTDAEVQLLAQGYRPIFIRPENLVGYWPLRHDDMDHSQSQTFHMTPINGPTFDTNEPPIIYTLPATGVPMPIRKPDLVEQPIPVPVQTRGGVVVPRVGRYP